MSRTSRALAAGSALVSALGSRLSAIVGAAGALALAGFLAAAVLAGPSLEATVKSYAWYDVSPMNPGDGGSSSFYLDAAHRYNAILGGLGDALTAAGRGLRVLYVVLGPDRPFAGSEVREVAEAYRTGNLRLLVADDLGVSRGLLEALGAAVPVGAEVNPGATGYWQYITTITCGPVSGPSSKALALAQPPGSRVLCRYRESGDPAVVWTPGPGWGGVLVVGDASIYSNFLYRGEVPWLGSSKALALYTLNAAGAGEADLIVFDISHYNVTVFRYEGHYGVGILAESFHALHNGLAGFASSHPLTASAVLTGLALALAAIIVGPSRGLLKPPRRRLSRADAAAVSRALDLLGYRVDEALIASASPGDAARMLREAVRHD